jgi:hypothetical protein
MKKLIIAIFLWLLTVPVAVRLSSSPSPGKTLRKNPPRPTQLTPVDCKLTLIFFRPNSWSCPQFPNDGANPTLNDGATNLSNRTTYYCKITVEPDQAATNASVFKTTWTKKAPFMNIKVPRECSSKITVEYYGNCNSCTGSNARPVFRYTAILLPAQQTCDAFLQYSLKVIC